MSALLTSCSLSPQCDMSSVFYQISWETKMIIIVIIWWVNFPNYLRSIENVLPICADRLSEFTPFYYIWVLNMLDIKTFNLLNFMCLYSRKAFCFPIAYIAMYLNLTFSLLEFQTPLHQLQSLIYCIKSGDCQDPGFWYQLQVVLNHSPLMQI